MTKSRQIIKSNAKINLYININGKNDRNYHDLTMINVPINLYDTIDISIDLDSDNIDIIDLNNVDMGPKENNLIYKVTSWFKKEHNLKFNILYKIYKEIPMESGTGGASSNAAFVIKYLNNYFNINQSNEEIIEMYHKFGADIAFFIYNKPALVQGEGEKIKLLDLNFKKYYFVLIKPNFGNSTKEIYSYIKNYNENPTDLLNFKNPFKNLKNDFSEILISQNKEFEKIISNLYDHGASYVNITGTGSTVFGIFRKEINAKNLNNKLQRNYKNIYVCNVIGENNE